MGPRESRRGGPRGRAPGSAKMRLFIAIDLDEAARSAVAAEQRRLAAALRGGSGRSSIKWVQADHMHLTLVFLGEIEEARAQPIIEDVAVDLPHPPFGLQFREVW